MWVKARDQKKSECFLFEASMIHAIQNVQEDFQRMTKGGDNTVQIQQSRLSLPKFINWIAGDGHNEDAAKVYRLSKQVWKTMNPDSFHNFKACVQ